MSARPVRPAAFLMFALASVAAGQVCPVAVGPGCDQIWLLVKGNPGPGLPAHFRHMRLAGGTFAGESGSEQPSPEGFAAIRAWLRSNVPGVNLVAVFDLRQESHGFIDGLPVNWYFGRDQVNCGKSREGMAEYEKRRLDTIRGLPAVQVYMSDVNGNSETACKSGIDPKRVPVKNVQTEAAVVESLNGSGLLWKYHRLYVADFHAPTDEIADDFVAVVRSLPPDSWLHFHCAAGDGRTTTFMAMAEIMRNAGHMTLEEILADQCRLENGAVNLCAYCAPPRWKNDWARERYWFIDLFYHYCKEQAPHYNESFSKWRPANSGRVPPPPECPLQPPCGTMNCKNPSPRTCDDC